MAKLLLCHPLFLSLSPDKQAASSPCFLLGLLYLAGYVREQGHQVAVFDGTFEAGIDAFQRRLVAEKPDLVGISALLPTQEMALELAAMARAAGVTVNLGGPDPTRDPLSYLAYPQVDLVVHHKGEVTLTHLLDRLNQGPLDLAALQEEPGLALRDGDGAARVNPPRPPIADLDSLPLPARDLIDMSRYQQTWQDLNGYASVTIAAARGCPYGCEWCQESVQGAAFRQRSPASVAAEVKLLKQSYQIDRLRMEDDVDGFSREWLEEWVAAAAAADAVVPFEALNDLERQDIPMLEVRDSL